MDGLHRKLQGKNCEFAAKTSPCLPKLNGAPRNCRPLHPAALQVYGNEEDVGR